MTEEQIQKACAESMGIEITRLKLMHGVIPNYPTSADSALSLVEALRKERWAIHIGNLPNGEWHAGFCQLQGLAYVDHIHTALTLPLAI